MITSTVIRRRRPTRARTCGCRRRRRPPPLPRRRLRLRRTPPGSCSASAVVPSLPSVFRPRRGCGLCGWTSWRKVTGTAVDTSVAAGIGGGIHGGGGGGGGGNAKNTKRKNGSDRKGTYINELASCVRFKVVLRARIIWRCSGELSPVEELQILNFELLGRRSKSRGGIYPYVKKVFSSL